MRGRAGLGLWPGVPGRLDQLRGQLHLHGPVPARRGIGPVVLSASQLAAAAVMLAIALAVSGAKTPHVTAVNVAAIAVLGVIGTGFAYVLNYQIITSEGATIASTVTYLLPVVAIVLGVLVLSENITAITLAAQTK
jgi:drug/metabolite transporter (DMT)-like permease